MQLKNVQGSYFEPPQMNLDIEYLALLPTHVTCAIFHNNYHLEIAIKCPPFFAKSPDCFGYNYCMWAVYYATKTQHLKNERNSQ